jgi:excisionase family DNA binding protein
LRDDFQAAAKRLHSTADRRVAPLKKRPSSHRAEALIDSREFYSISQIAALLDMDEIALYRFAKLGDLPPYKLGSTVRFRGSDLEGFVKKRRPPSVNKD